MKFHESLPALIATLARVGFPFGAEALIVRDAKGCLFVGSAKALDPELAKKVTGAVAESLGCYAGELPLIPSEVVGLLLADKAVRLLHFQSGDDAYQYNLLDRRVIGADWLRKSVVEVKAPKRLVFASLKGGVGRSTALAVLAADLARSGKKVLAVDLDLEAPGIGYMFLRENLDLGLDRRPRFGVVDYLLENSLCGICDEELIDFIGVSPFAEGSIDVIPAVGRETDLRPDTMIAKLARSLTEDAGPEGVKSLAEQISEMIDRFAEKAAYDAILIDARAGLSEITAAPLLSLGAEILLFGIDQPQTFRGYSFLLSHISFSLASLDDRAIFDSWRRGVHFVHAKAKSSAAKRGHFRECVYEMCAEYLYDLESVGQFGGEVFSPAPSEVGAEIPHDTLYISSHPDYEAFDPIGDLTQLDPEVYRGPFGDFLEKARTLLELKVESNEIG